MGTIAGVWQAPVSPWDQVVSFLLNHNVVDVLLMLGLPGWAGELAVGGAVFPGVIGTICLILALVGLLLLTTNWVGVALVLAGGLMFVLDIAVVGHGLSIGGLMAFALG